MKKNLSYLLMVISALFFHQTAQAGKGLIVVEQAMESMSLKIKISKDLTGIVTGKVCQSCELQVIKITPSTQLYVAGKKVSLKLAGDQNGKEGVVFFNPDTKTATRITSYK